MMKKLTYSGDERKRLDVFAAEATGLTRNAVQKMVEAGYILLNGEQCKASNPLKYGDILDVDKPPLPPLELVPEAMALDVIYEDKLLMVVNKPQGVVVHPSAGHERGTLVHGLLHHCNQLFCGEDAFRPGIVHRLDKDTSGLLVVAKTSAAHLSLSAQLAEHSVIRRYHAIVFNNIKTDNGTINAPIGRHLIDRKKMAVTEKNSRRAVTHYKVLERLGKFCLVELQLETGRTHQIRVHMAHMGHPVMGDAVYGGGNAPVKTNGQLLHACVLGFVHPGENLYMEFYADLPCYFENALKTLRLRWR